MSPRKQLRAAPKRALPPRLSFVKGTSGASSTGAGSGSEHTSPTTRSMLNAEAAGNSAAIDSEPQSTPHSANLRKGSPLSDQAQKRMRTVWTNEDRQLILERMDLHAENTARAFASLSKWQDHTETAVAALQKHKVVVDDRVDRLERQADVTIRGVPLTGREDYSDLREIVVKLGAAIHCELTDRDIVHAYRTRPRDNRGAIIMVRFGSVGVRTHFFKCYMVNKCIDSSCLGLQAGTNIYVSDNLTKNNLLVRTRAVQLKNDGLIAFHTVRDGIVNVTLVNEDRRNKHPVRSVEELDALVEKDQEDCDRSRRGRSSSSVGGAHMGTQ